MKKTDKQTMDMLRTELMKSSENAKVPLKLQKDSVVAMLKNSDKNEKDFSSKTGNKRNIVVLRRITAAAAVIAVVIIAAFYVNSGGVKVIKTDSFYKGYESKEPVRNAESYAEIEKAVKEILDNKKSVEKNKKPDNGKTPDSTESSTKGSAESLIEGYSEYVAQAKLPDSAKLEAELSLASVQGVVEQGDFRADIVKTDGEYLYIVTTGIDKKTGRNLEQIKIVKASPAEEMNVAPTLVLSNGADANKVDECIEIYLKNDTLIAILRRYSFAMDQSVAKNSIQTVAVHYDISDPTAPKRLREHIQDGAYVTSGLYENSLSIVTQMSIPSTETQSEESVVPSYSINGEKTKLAAENVFISVNDPEDSYLFITVTDISDYKSPVGRLAVLGCGKEVYCASRTIAVARGFISVDADKNGEHSSLTEIYRFNISGSSIAFSGSYIVKGSLTGGISVDEKSGYLRAATAEKDSNNLYVLDEKMEFVSGLAGILPGKKIKSIKFIGENAYFVAGGESEKTVIIDISDSSKPVVAGSISTEGFSHELYMLSETKLLGAGIDPDGSTVISLFDVSDAANPKTVAVYKLEGDFRIPCADDTRCAMVDEDKMIFGLPIVNVNPASETEISAYILFDVSQGISPMGTYTHETAYTGDAAVRGVCIDDALYTVSGERVVAFSIDKCTVISSQTIR